VISRPKNWCCEWLIHICWGSHDPSFVHTLSSKTYYSVPTRDKIRTWCGVCQIREFQHYIFHTQVIPFIISYTPIYKFYITTFMLSLKSHPFLFAKMNHERNPASISYLFIIIYVMFGHPTQLAIIWMIEPWKTYYIHTHTHN